MSAQKGLDHTDHEPIICLLDVCTYTHKRDTMADYDYDGAAADDAAGADEAGREAT